MNLEIIILAAGQGTRMRSSLPKVLHAIGGRPMLSHVIATAKALEPSAIHVVYGHGGDQVMAHIADDSIHWVEQDKQLGTGHAVEQAMPMVKAGSTVLVLYGDVPLITESTLRRLLQTINNGISLLTVELIDPTGYGRIVRDYEGNIEAIVEQKDATSQQLAITEGNTGILACDGDRLRSWLQRLDNDNAQGEYYLTDVIALAVADGLLVHSNLVTDVDEVAGVNDRVQLAQLERRFQQRMAEQLMRDGVTLIDPARFDVRGKIKAGKDVIIDVGVVFEGDVELGDRVRIGANCVLRDVKIGNDVVLEPMCLIEQARIIGKSTIGPYARIRPGTEVGEGAKVGNFVEIKNSVIGRASKISHLSYIGDTTMGDDVNIGAGTITVNYDGVNKHRTIIGDNAFIGSDSQLIAPITIGDGATVGAGSTITRDAPASTLTLSRSAQKSIQGWKRPVKKSKS